MKVQIKSSAPNVELVELSGELDFHSSPEVRAAFTAPVEKQLKKILIDLTKVGYIDSSGLATFVELFQKLKRHGGKLILFNLSPSVRSVFEIAKLDGIFKLAGSEKDALSLVS